MQVAPSDVEKYGIAKIDTESRILELVEKPKASEAPSQLALPGRYIFKNKIFDYLEKTPPGRNQEIQLTDAMNLYCKEHPIYGKKIKALRLDTGNPVDFICSSVHIALQSPEYGPSIQKKLHQVLGNDI